MNLQVGVKALLKNPEGKFLILKRSEEKYGKLTGCWDIVGGRIDPGTNLLENLEREIFEETKLKLSSTPRLIAAQDIIPNSERHIVRLTYVADATGTPELDMVEHTEYRWCSLEELSREPELDSYVRMLLDDGALTQATGTQP